MTIESEPKETQKEIIFAHPVTRDFLLEAHRDGAIKRFLDSEVTRNPRGVRSGRNYAENLWITTTYFATEKSKEEIYAANYPEAPLTHQAISLIVGSTLREIWNCASQESGIQNRFPLDQIPTKKPVSKHRAFRMSAGSGGTLKEIARKSLEGASFEEVAGITGANNLHQNRKALRKYGIEVPYHKFFSPDAKEERFNKLTDVSLEAADLKEYFDSLTQGQKRSIIGNRKDLVISLFDCSGLAGLYLRTIDVKLIKDALEKAEIAIANYTIPNKKSPRELKGYWIRRVDIGRAIEALKGDPALTRFRENPVKLLSGKADKAPNTTVLIKKRGYSRVGNLADSLGVHFGSKISAEDFFRNTDCSVPIFKWASGIFYPTDPKSVRELGNFIVRRKRELGI